MSIEVGSGQRSTVICNINSDNTVVTQLYTGSLHVVCWTMLPRLPTTQGVPKRLTSEASSCEETYLGRHESSFKINPVYNSVRAVC